jgi:hypothetical protein
MPLQRFRLLNEERNMVRWGRLFGAAVLALTGASSAIAEDIAFKIGMILRLSGAGVNIGEDTPCEGAHYVAVHKSDLPHSVPAEPFKSDDGSNVDQTKRLADKLAVRDNVRRLNAVNLSPGGLAISSRSTISKMPTALKNSTTGQLTRLLTHCSRFDDCGHTSSRRLLTGSRQIVSI